MTTRTEERWPRADVLVEYLREFAASQAAFIRYNTTVTRVAKHADGRLHVATKSTGADNGGERSHVCTVVVVATGLWKPNLPSTVEGIELAESYADLPGASTTFRGQAVLVLGQGNAALETANAAAPYANYVHLVPGRLRPEHVGEDQHDFASWESRYVGHARAINAAILDSYLLKSLDGIALSPSAQDSVMVRCGLNQSRICVFIKGPTMKRRGEASSTPEAVPPGGGGGGGGGGHGGGSAGSGLVKTVDVGRFSTRDSWSVAAVARLRADGHVVVTYDLSEEDSRISVGGMVHSPDGSAALLDERPLQTLSKVLYVGVSAIRNATVVDVLVELARRGGTPHPLVYDRVVSCLGWKHATAVYGAESGGVLPELQYNGKYPIMTSEYESVNVPGLFFAGQLGHGKDHLRSAGGFIHGFRYTTRALFRILEARRGEVQHATDRDFGAGAGASLPTGVLPSPQPQRWPGATVFAAVHRWDGETGLRPNGCNGGDWTAAHFAAEFGDGDGSQPEAVRCPVAVRTGTSAATGFERLLNTIFTRINVASGPYQMVAVLGDGVVFSCGGSAGADRAVEAVYQEEVPVEYFHAQNRGRPRLIWHFGYKQQRQSLHDSRRLGTHFEVHMWWHPGTCAEKEGGAAAAGPDEPADADPPGKVLLRIGEDLHTNWNAFEIRKRVGEWLHAKVAAVGSAEADAAALKAHRDREHYAAMLATLESLDRLTSAQADSCVDELATTAGCADSTTALRDALSSAQRTVAADDPPPVVVAAAADDRTLSSWAELADDVDRCLQPAAAGPAQRWRTVSRSKLDPTDNGGGGMSGSGSGSRTASAAETSEHMGPMGPLGPLGPLGPVGTRTFGYEEHMAREHAKRKVACAVEAGRRWPGGRVELNVANFGTATGTVSVWHGSTLYQGKASSTSGRHDGTQPEPELIHREDLAPGEGKRFLTHEREVWQIRPVGNGNATAGLELVVDVSNGIVQDMVFRD
jgi:thioredoxin reductase